MTKDSRQTIAAADLGSNSFHMVVARRVSGGLEIIDRLKEPVRLAAGLNDAGELDDAAKARAFDALDRFGERVRDIPNLSMRAVGTSAMRSARRGKKFRAKAEARLGHPIEIVTGDEEARLIYLGVAHTMGRGKGPRLVIDIGGGSTEVIVGEGFSADLTASIPLGCVRWSKQFFPKGKIKAKRFERAVKAASHELKPVVRQLRKASWEEVIGASGTIRAAARVAGGGEVGAEVLDREGLEFACEQVLACEDADELAKISGLGSSRAPVFAGGLSVLLGLFDSLHLKRLKISAGAMREGVIYDLLDRLRDTD
ncbi:MAG: Ppx/GppA family phosphatase [Planctomycetota bacterium]